MSSILYKLAVKVQELKNSGMSGDDIKNEGLSFLKNLLKDSTFSERKEFWLHIDRDKKLDILFSNDK